MKMRTFLQNKLWRDKMVDMCERNGSRIIWRRLNDAEYDCELRIKLCEEAAEISATASRNELIGELSDLFEVIDALCSMHGISRNEIMAAQQKKNTERGGFSRRMFVETATHLEGTPMVDYCLAQPEKYPEVI